MLSELSQNRKTSTARSLLRVESKTVALTGTESRTVVGGGWLGEGRWDPLVQQEASFHWGVVLQLRADR